MSRLGWVGGVARSPLGVAAGLVLGCVVGIGAALVFTQSPQQAAAERAVPTLPVVTAQVVTQQLTDSIEVGCEFSARQLDAYAPRSAGKFRSRVVTAIGVKAGDRLRSGTFVAAVSTRPVFAFVTTVPFFRDLRLGDTGPDVKALEKGLVAAGKLDRADDRFDQATLAALGAIYRKAGLAGPSRFVADAAWAVPAGSRVSGVQVSVGDVVKADTAVVTAQSGLGHWACRVPAGITVADGDTLKVVADSEKTTAKVTGIAVDEETNETKATISLPHSVGADSSVTATVVSQASDGAVVTVPAGALYTTADSATSVRVMEANTVREVPVTTGTAAGGWVEVSGDGLAAGQTVQIRGA